MPAGRDLKYSSSQTSVLGAKWTAVLIQNGLHVCRSNRTNACISGDTESHRRLLNWSLSLCFFRVIECQLWIINYEVLSLFCTCSIIEVVSECYLSSVSHCSSCFWVCFKMLGCSRFGGGGLTLSMWEFWVRGWPCATVVTQAAAVTIPDP